MALIKEIVDDWYGNNQYNSKITSSLIEMAPGSGKTITAFRLAKLFKEQAAQINGWDPKDVGIGWIAGRRNLLKQAQLENEALVKCDDVFYISQFSNDVSDCGLFDFKHRMFIIDEAHHEACSSMHGIINAFDPEYMLGLSATPKRTDKAKLCFQKSYKTAGFYNLIDEGWLAQFDHWNLPNWSPSTVTAQYLSDPEKWGKSIMFFKNRQLCDEAVAILKSSGIRAASGNNRTIGVDLVTGTTDRDSQIDAFERGELDVLVNMFVLTEGFDCPSLKTVWVRDSSRLPTIQMAGRVLRPHEDIPVVNIVQSTQTRWPFIRTANIAQRQMVLVDDHWERIDRSEKLDKVIKESIRKTATVDYNSEILKKLRSKNFGMRRRRRRR